MEKKLNVLAELLKCALFDAQIEEHVKKKIADNARAVYETALRHDLVHLVEYANKKSGIEIEDEMLCYDFLKSQAMAVMRYENQKVALGKISQLLENEKIPFVALKGAVIRQFYPEMWMRTSCDIDILVHECDIKRAVEVIEEKLGFRAEKEWHYHDVSLFSGNDVHVELHFSVKEDNVRVDKLLEKVWDYACPVKEGAYEHRLTNEFFMFEQIAHMAYHFSCGGCGIRSFVDLYLLEEKLDFDRNELEQMLVKTGLKTFYEACVRYSRVWFTEACHDEVTTEMHDYLVRGAAYGSKQNSVAIRTENKGGLAYLTERIFMPYSKLVILYPSLSGKPYLTPFYEVKRWIRSLCKGRLSSVANELEIKNAVTDEKTNQINALLKKVGLK